MTHSYQAGTWHETPSERLSYGSSDSRRLNYDFFVVYKRRSDGLGVDAPETAHEAVTAAETAGANLRVDGQFVPPTGLTTPPSGLYYILSSMTVERLPDTNGEASDVVWMFRCVLENSGLASTSEPFVTVQQQATVANVSAFRIDPTIPTDNFTTVALNDAVWHGTTDIGGIKVDWASQPIQYALPIRNISINIVRPAPVWQDGGTRDVGAISAVNLDSPYLGQRNSVALGWMGNVGYLLFVGVNCSPLNDGLYRLSYSFRYHPWKHAVQVPYMVGGTYSKAENANNATRLQNNNIWWGQPHLQGFDFKNTLQITTEEWDAINL